ncbi:uncharacterized protein LY89DRAFT_372825 [Mollisia scopiformis]|uniref:Uncharacterized protein n=1 Tax=Mollisia scopiformis TaxID=149040 RepID=A0A132B3H0_MOLSC|nr:uncharacterized protein LY89DRAFT_372825 [Mollisia scopiformis]KUJ06945.1 hypothetical protein LY89DRAFT_372825 [Mollisia scopiformis]
MSVGALVPNHTGKSVYLTPEQSPTALHIYDPFANPEGLDDLEDEKTDKSEDSLLKGAHQPGQNGTNAPTEKPGLPEAPPRPPGQGHSGYFDLKKEPPQLPLRSPNEPARSLKPTPTPPTRAGPAPFRQRATIPPPTIDEDDSASEDGKNGPPRYTRELHKLIAYLIPLPKPKLTKNTENEDSLPERFLIYTPPQPHFLKPAKGIKEPKKHWCKRKLQEEVQKAKKFDGKTLSLRGLHSKTTKGVVWAIHRIKSTDIVFLGRIQSEEVDEIVLISPTSVTHTIPEIRDEFVAQITRTKKKATKEAAISTFLLPVTLTIDTLAAIVWPFGGLFEIDVVWAYASIKGWNTSRIITKRLGARDSAFGKYGGKERDLYLRFQQDEKMEVLSKYLAECCHKKNPRMFDSAGVPPTEIEVMRAIGWTPVVRGRTGGERQEGETGWADEEWQSVVFEDDFKATMERGAGSWSKWCEKFEKKPEKMLKK